MTKLLIDECLSGNLALLARERGFHTATHVIWLGKAGWKDWELKPFLLAEEWVLVTRNCKDFRGPQDAPGSKGVLSGVAIHAGLVCLEAPVGMDLEEQTDLFLAALQELVETPDMTNQVLEVSRGEPGGDIQVGRYEMPRS